MYQKFALIALAAFTEAIRLDCGPCCDGSSQKDEEEVVEELIQSTFEISPVASATVAEVLEQNPETYEEADQIMMAVMPELVELETQELAPMEAYQAGKAILFKNDDCSGDTYEWQLDGEETWTRNNYGNLSGWNDKGKSVMVPPGHQLNLWQHANKGGTKLEFFGQTNEDGSLVCQDLGELKNQMSDSTFFVSVEEDFLGQAILYRNADCTGETYEWNLGADEWETRNNYGNLSGWNDKGQSVQVPPGYQLNLWQHANKGGAKLRFFGQANEDGTLVCQDLGELKNQMSDSRFFIPHPYRD